ncbi:DUF5683 domain-containing protein [Elizabethkingia sp. JS20170427COW]|uniref:DUF5683 domain-containing protein n=1 Tax=Elizabethkingia sp. JS20170427COW TaxID=2583851 RepID=UPI0011100B7B|nr:DUF5683 domain-containing protein [Elizabethkingia sp. JS20170427COW]QCX52510.1 hypothetical protein FGE20_01485 [Elizabethkingia sp. JS20170427COW]
MRRLLFFCTLLMFHLTFAQVKQDSVPVSQKEELSIMENKSPEEIAQEIEKVNKRKIETISPTKAGLYSAILPGLGQMYNRKYWKIPIVWGAVGTGVGIAIWNQNQYNRYRKAFVASLNGQEHEFSNIPGVTSQVLGNIQDKSKRQRDYAIAITGLIYVLGIIDAVVDAHLAPMKADPDLALSPVLIYDQSETKPATPGLALRFKF